MNTMTNDQYIALSKLTKWYDKYQNQIIEISGVIGTGIWDVIQQFIEYTELDARNIMYLSYNQKQVLELAFKKYHAYYINGVLYKYTKIVDFSSLPVINSKSNMVKYEWQKILKSKIDVKYKMMIVFDSTLINYNTLKDLSSFGIPIILIRDPMLLPAPDSYTFSKDPDIELNEINLDYLKSPITYFIHKIINDEKLNVGNYDNLSIINKKQMNLYNIKSSDMNITISDDLRNEINKTYREKILKRKDLTTMTNERVIIMSDMYNHKLINQNEKNIKIYLRKGVVGNISRINKHTPNTKWVNCDFKPDFYHESFIDLIINRHYLNKLLLKSYQIIPDESVNIEYAYALTPTLSRLNHWNKVTLILDTDDALDPIIYKKMMYTAMTRAKGFLTIVI